MIAPGDNSPGDAGLGAGEAAVDSAPPIDAVVPSSCPPGYVVTTQGCFYLLAPEHTVADAEQDCEQTIHLDVRAHLAVIDNLIEAQAVADVMAGEPVASIGLFFRAFEMTAAGSWIWVTGGTWGGAVPWLDGAHPDQDAQGSCALLVGSGDALVRTNCVTPRLALCEWDGNPPTQTVP